MSPYKQAELSFTEGQLDMVESLVGEDPSPFIFALNLTMAPHVENRTQTREHHSPQSF